MISATEKLIREEGYAAVTSRRIADQAGLKHQVIYYYFDTLDDLLLEVFRRGADSGLAVQKKALEAEQPLRALWEVVSDPRGARFLMEFLALANHNEVIRAEIRRYANETRRMQADALERHLKSRGLEPQMSPLLAMLLMSASARLLVNEANLGIDTGHDELLALIETSLREFEQLTAAPAPDEKLLDRA
ncbi:helix-turn-helix domain containing protein [Phenylobacterium sp. LjRoot219]|uniref:TetR/AcrR family transcriptional regulator n=1 Tax=Phenylobacterium sp. LjRoot219 TaxID=3342283 RepID=UPI003ED02F5A